MHKLSYMYLVHSFLCTSCINDNLDKLISVSANWQFNRGVSVMGRTKGSGGGSKGAHSEGPSPAPSDVSTTSTIASAEARIKENLKELFTLIHQVQVL